MTIEAAYEPGKPFAESSRNRFQHCWCGGQKSEDYAEGFWIAQVGFVKFVQCADCRTIRQVDIPPDELVYQDSYWDPYPKETQHKTAAAATAMRDYWEWRGKGLKMIMLRDDEQLAVCEFGCGWGEMLALFMAHNWRVIGCDLGERSYLQCLEHLGEESPGNPRMRHGKEDVITKADGPFDLAILWHVIEHCRKPLETLAHLRSLIPHGRAVVQAPDCSFTRPEVQGPASDPSPDYTLRADHVWYFTQEQAAALFQKAGFHVDRMHNAAERYGNPNAWAAWITASD